MQKYDTLFMQTFNLWLKKIDGCAEQSRKIFNKRRKGTWWYRTQPYFIFTSSSEHATNAIKFKTKKNATVNKIEIKLNEDPKACYI